MLKEDDKEAIEAKTQVLTEASHKMAEQLYAQAQQAQAGAEAATGAQSGDDGPGASEKEKVVDAEFEEVKDTKQGKS